MNIRHVFLAFLALLLTSLVIVPHGHCAGEEEAIKNAWNKFIDARKKGDGAAALRVVSSSTVKRMSEVRDLALNGSGNQLKAKPLSMKTEVLELRLNNPRGQLSVMSPERLVERYFAQPMKQQTDITFKKFDVAGDKAIAETENGIRIQFVNENGWRIDWPGYIEYADGLAKQRIQAMGQDENSLVLDALTVATKKKVGPEIWEASNYK